MIEGFRHFKNTPNANPYSRFFIFTDLFLFAIDFGIAFIYTPGLLAAIFLHDYLIVGPTTILLFPITLIMFGIMLSIEYFRVFKPNGLKIRGHWGALLVFILTYSIILSPACLRGYWQELVGTKRKWK